MRLTSQIASLDRRSENFREDPAAERDCPTLTSRTWAFAGWTGNRIRSRRAVLVPEEDRQISALHSRKTTCTKHNDPFADEGLRLRCCTWRGL